MKRRRRGTRRRVFTFSLQAGEGKKRKFRKLRQKPRRYQKAAYGNPRDRVEVVTLPNLPNLRVPEYQLYTRVSGSSKGNLHGNWIPLHCKEKTGVETSTSNYTPSTAETGYKSLLSFTPFIKVLHVCQGEVPTSTLCQYFVQSPQFATVPRIPLTSSSLIIDVST